MAKVWASQVRLVVKDLLANAGDVRGQIGSLSGEDPLEEEIATHSNVLAWRTSWTRSLVGYSPWGRKESVTHD